jgi:hypothetical protein
MNSYDPNERGSRAQEDLGGGLRAAREGDLAGQDEPIKARQRRPINPDRSQLGTPRDVTAPDEVLAANRANIDKIREQVLTPAEKGLGETATQAVGVQQELFE